MGRTGDPPVPVGDSPTGTQSRHQGKAQIRYLRTLLSFRLAGRQSKQAGRLCYPFRMWYYTARLVFETR